MTGPGVVQAEDHGVTMREAVPMAHQDISHGREAQDLSRMDDRRSKAAIAGHPLHPMVVPLPIAFLLTTLVADAAFHLTGDSFWARLALWTLGAGLVTGLVAGLLGAIDFATVRRARASSAGWIHAVGNSLALLLSTGNLVYRFKVPDDTEPTGLMLSVAVAVILVITAWAGGELVYRQGIGVDRRS